jgi:DNA-binding GntR family transcriptional regulator
MPQSDDDPRYTTPEFLDRWQVVRQLLADRIIEGSLEPGATLSETELAHEYGTSRGPIRTALQDLARVGLVSAGEATKRRMSVARFETRDIDELYEVICGLERIAAPLAIANSTDEDIANLWRALERLEQAQATGELRLSVRADLAFHQQLVDMSGNSRLLGLWSTIVEQIRYSIATTQRSIKRIVWAEANRPIAEAVATRDPIAAEEAIVQAFETAHRRIVEYRKETERGGT